MMLLLLPSQKLLLKEICVKLILRERLNVYVFVMIDFLQYKRKKQKSFSKFVSRENAA